MTHLSAARFICKVILTDINQAQFCHLSDKPVVRRDSRSAQSLRRLIRQYHDHSDQTSSALALPPPTQFSSNCFKIQDSRRLSRSAAFSTYRFFVSPWSYSNICVLFKCNCLIDLLSSRTLFRFPFTNPRKFAFNNSLQCRSRSYSFCSNCSQER